jgi:hypothetical protein
LNNKFAGNFGGGIQGKITQRVALDLSVRAFQKTPTFDFPNPTEASWMWNFRLNWA